MKEGKVEHGSRYQPDIDNIAACGPQSFGERHTEGLRTQPVITAYRQAPATLLTHVGAKSEADALHIVDVEVTPHDTADIVFPENLGVHRALPVLISLSGFSGLLLFQFPRLPASSNGPRYRPSWLPPR